MMAPFCTLAQVETVAVFVAVIGCYGLVVGVIWKVVEHVYQGDKHPSKQEIVFRDTCAAVHAGMEKCLDAKFSAANDRINVLQEMNMREFAEIKSLIKSNSHKP